MVRLASLCPIHAAITATGTPDKCIEVAQVCEIDVEPGMRRVDLEPCNRATGVRPAVNDITGKLAENRRCATGGQVFIIGSGFRDSSDNDNLEVLIIPR